MNNQSSFKSRRPRQSFGNKHVKHTSNRGGYKSNWKSKNRPRFITQLDHSMYVSKAVDSVPEITYVPDHNFYEFGLHPTLTKNIAEVGYVTPTKIQDQAIPQILNGKDLLGIGKTGSGKTGAFLIPMINKALKNREENILIICPTRELASQINTEFKKLAKNTSLNMVLVMGGASGRDQIRQIRTKPQFVVATPGRLMDLERRNVVKLWQFNNIILDEVDQMLDMGFVKDIQLIISKLAKEKQTLFFSATMSNKEETLANTLLKDPIKVASDKQSPHESVHQDIIKVESKEHKMDILHGLLKKSEFNKVLIFSGTKRFADKISKELQSRGITADSLHGGKSQSQRTSILNKFRQDRLDVLVATDVAARGIDIPDISHVINYDEPACYNDYIHRIGRTGRIGKKGIALTFVVSKSRTN